MYSNLRALPDLADIIFDVGVLTAAAGFRRQERACIRTYAIFGCVTGYLSSTLLQDRLHYAEAASERVGIEGGHAPHSGFLWVAVQQHPNAASCCRHMNRLDRLQETEDKMQERFNLILASSV